jgi:hypothetical protein
VDPDAVSYNLAMKACGSAPGTKLRAAQLERAFGLLADMRARGVAPTYVTITQLLSLCAQAGQGHRALQLYQVPHTLDLLAMGMGRSCLCLVWQGLLPADSARFVLFMRRLGLVFLHQTLRLCQVCC